MERRRSVGLSVCASTPITRQPIFGFFFKLGGEIPRCEYSLDVFFIFQIFLFLALLCRVVRLSIKIERGGANLRNASVTFSLFSSAVPPGSGAFQMPTRPSASAASASTLRGGKGQSQKRFSNFFSF